MSWSSFESNDLFEWRDGEDWVPKSVSNMGKLLVLGPLNIVNSSLLIWVVVDWQCCDLSFKINLLSL